MEKIASSAGDSGSGLQDSDRKIIRTGNITLEVTTIGKAMDEVAAIATELGGYVVSSTKYETQDRISAGWPSVFRQTRFNDAFVRLRAIAIKVPNESTNSQDVTEEYTDLTARLHNLEATEAQYLSLLKQAKTVEEILKVQRAVQCTRRD